MHVPATARSCESYPRSGSHIHAAENDESRAPRQRVGDECRRRLMSMLCLAPTLCCFGTEELAGPSGAAGRVASYDAAAMGAAFGPCPRVTS